MKKYKIALILTTALGAAFVSTANAGTLRVINKISREPVYLFFRGEGSDTHSSTLIEAGQQKNLIIESPTVKGKPTFEVIASTSNEGNPDWKLMGGKCVELVTDSDHTIIVDSTLGKISCKNVTADNPMPFSGYGK